MMKFTTLVLLFFNLLVPSICSAKSAQQNSPTPKLTMRLSVMRSTSTPWPDFQVTFENSVDGDAILNLGFMIANGQRLEPDQISLVLTSADGTTRELKYTIAYVIAGRLDDYIVPLRAGSTYSVRLSLTQFWSPKTKEFPPLKLSPGSYRIRAEFAGKGADHINLDTPGMRLLHFWTGQLRSEEVVFIVK